MENGYLIKTTTANRDEMTYYTDPFFSTLKWKYYNPESGTDISAERLENTIHITGQFKNKKYEEKIKIDNLPWYQDKDWGLGLKSFINSDKDSTLFWSIDQNSFRIAKFEAKKEKPEIIDINGQKTESIHVKLSLAGWMKVFWGGGEMWFRKSDGRLVLEKMNPDDPNEITQLIEER